MSDGDEQAGQVREQHDSGRVAGGVQVSATEKLECVRAEHVAGDHARRDRPGGLGGAVAVRPVHRGDKPVGRGKQGVGEIAWH